MLFLGTGAAELIPNPFCACETCQNARLHRDPRDLRRRSALLLDSENIVDFGPDVPYACGVFGVSLTGLKNVFLTHLHADHFALSSFEELFMTADPPHLKVFLSPEACVGLERLRRDLSALDYACFDRPFHKYLELCELIPVRPYTEYQADGFRFSAIRGFHGGIFKDEKSLNYLFEKDGRKLVYALDTGLFPEENYAYLQDRRIDTLVIDATFGKLDIDEGNTHLNLAFLERVLGRLDETNALTQQSRIILTHIGMKGKLGHEQYAAAAFERLGKRVTVAFDGMEASF